MHRPQSINNRFFSRISGFLNLSSLRLCLALALLRVVGDSAPD